MVNQIEEKGLKSAIIKMRPGLGKTILAINICNYFDQQVLVVVDRDVLINQWIESIHQLINIDKDLYGEKGIIQTKKNINDDRYKYKYEC